MNKEEIIKALEIIKKPITVNCIEYKYFDEENYNKITNVYNNCLWFANNLELINLTVENLEKENQQLKEQLEKSEKARKEAIEYVKKRNFDRAEILVDMECEYYYDDDFKDSLLYILEKQ